MIQSLNWEDQARKDILRDIGTEELSHPEIVGTLARLHLKPMKKSREAADGDPHRAGHGTPGDPGNPSRGFARLKFTRRQTAPLQTVMLRVTSKSNLRPRPGHPDKTPPPDRE